MGALTCLRQKIFRNAHTGLPWSDMPPYTTLRSVVVLLRGQECAVRFFSGVHTVENLQRPFRVKHLWGFGGERMSKQNDDHGIGYTKQPSQADGAGCASHLPMRGAVPLHYLPSRVISSHSYVFLFIHMGPKRVNKWKRNCYSTYCMETITCHVEGSKQIGGRRQASYFRCLRIYILGVGLSNIARFYGLGSTSH